MKRIFCIQLLFCLAVQAQETIFDATLSHTPLSTDRVFYRFYLLQRLKPAVDIFLKVINEKRLQETGSLELICSFNEAQIELFAHPLIQKQVLYMCEHHDNKTLVRLVETVQQYRYIHDDAYVKEVVMLLLIVYENIIGSLSRMKQSDPMPITAQSAAMTSASLDTLLHKLDSMSDELDTLYSPQVTSGATYWKPLASLLTIALGTTAWLWYVQSC